MHKLVLCLITLLFPAFIFAEINQGGEIPIHADFARFKASKGYTYLEIHLAFSRNAFEHKPVADQFESEIELRVNIIKEDSLVASDSWKMIDRVQDLESITSGQQVFDQYSSFLKEGEYKIKLIVRDHGSVLSGWYERDIEILPFPEEALAVSDIQLGYNLTPDKNKGKFIKNGYKILPNPMAIYSADSPLLYYYCELYNFSQLAANSDSTYVVNINFVDLKGNLVKTMPQKTRTRQGASLVEVGQVNVGNLSPAVYQMQMEVIDMALQDTASQYKNFMIYGQQKEIALGGRGSEDESLRVGAEFSGLSEEELDDMFDKSRYIATRDEQKVYNNLELEGKKQFMATFWRKRDINRNTDFNEYMQDYFQRVSISNARFRSGNKEGWRTNQGRIYILYGEPNEIERFPSSMGEKPYEIWYYHNVEGGVEFVFVDISGFGRYELVHSTSRLEIQDYGWMDRWLRQ